MTASAVLAGLVERALGRQPKRLLDWEPVVTRSLFALIVATEAPIRSGLEFRSAPYPNGLAQYLALGSLSDWSTWLLGGFWLALVLYAAGIWLPLSALYLTVIAVIAGTLHNSQGAFGHSHQVMTLLLGAQFVAFTWSHLLHKDRALLRGHELSALISPQLIAFNYVTSAITKLRRSGLDWVRDSPDVAVEVVKTHSQAFYNDLTPGMLERGQAVADFLLSHQTATRIFIGGGLAVELFAFLGLFGKRSGLLAALAIVGLHAGVKTLMTLDFRANQYCALLFLGHGAFWLLWGLEKLFPARSPAASG